VGESKPIMISMIFARRHGSRGIWQAPTTLNKMGLRRKNQSIISSFEAMIHNQELTMVLWIE
jgi:hypothetical protein